MAITYPLAFPTASGLASISFSGKSTVAISESPFTGQQQVQAYPKQLWLASVELPPLKRPEAEQWIAFLLSLNGKQGTFLMGDPSGATPRGIATGTPLLNGAHAANVNSLITDGWTASQTGILLTGDYIQLGTGAASRLHKVLADVNSDATGNATFDIWPSTSAAYSDNAALIVQNTKASFRLDENISGWSVTESILYGISFSATQAI
jgi:hypothetical protein